MSKRIMAGDVYEGAELVATLELTVDHAGYHVALVEAQPAPTGKRKAAPLEPWATTRGLESQREAKTAGLSLAGSFFRARNIHRWGITWRALP